MDPEQTSAPKPQFVNLFKEMGPAWIITAVACGPATMASVSLAGSSYGYQLYWVIILSAVLAFVAQYMAAKIGLIAGRGIIGLVEKRWGKFWAWVLALDALLATWLAAAVLLKALVSVGGVILGLTSPWWSLAWVGLIALLVGKGGYRMVERVSKVLVSLIVLSFVITVIKVGFDPVDLASGLAPSLPGGIGGALTMAGIMGGAVHVTIIGMHTYNVNARGWDRSRMSLALSDTFWSMLVAFGFYSSAIFIAAAAVLHPQGIIVYQALDLAKPLEPFLGPLASAVFLTGLLAAVFSTIIPTYLAGGYFLADKLGWELSIKDDRFRNLVLLGCAISLIGPMLKGGFVVLLVTMLALGLCGTPLVMLIMLILLNDGKWAGEHKNGFWLNIMGLVALLTTTFLALRFVAAKLGWWV